ncbi:HIRAN domain-containing protein [Sphingomonas sp. H160509]|uniref:HIRAN domain-containing protein n=1 Tax=Sphingomonas sp. H160509 TaxID=2955313 RepID=UPI0020978CAF|nr:HIRAN domain-containing protein [Sphingomonas sp. H160509]MDD1453111.1 HIRAN domain-containing protein [Sphingomonas sp. H160509]
MSELTTSIVGLDFPNEDKSKSSRVMECMLCRPGEMVELRLEPKTPYDQNAITVWSRRGVQMGYVSAEHARLIGKRMDKDEVSAIFQTMHRSRAYIRIRFGGGLPTLPDPVPDVPNYAPQDEASAAAGARSLRILS